ncbi:MAG TPA: hypothetical protein VIR03_02085 [Candidatus Saccharimonadales bacterium]
MSETSKKNVKIINKGGNPFGGFYLVTYVGAAVYFIHHTQGFWGVVWALVKAMFWPGFVVYRAMEMMHIVR